MSIQENTFAEACYEQNTIKELEDALNSHADEDAMEAWNLSEGEYFDQIQEALDELLEEEM